MKEEAVLGANPRDTHTEVTASLLRSAASVTVLVVLYYTAPLEHTK